MLQLYVSLGSVFYFMLRQCCALVRFRHKNHLARVRKTSFGHNKQGWKYLEVSLKISQLEIVPKSSQHEVTGSPLTATMYDCNSLCC